MGAAIVTKLAVRPGTLDFVIQQLGSMQGAARRALSSAINDTLAKAKTASAKGIAASVNIKQGEIKKRLTITKSNENTLSGILTVSGKRLPLIAFKARQTKKGVAYTISKKEGRKVLAGAFITSVIAGKSGEEKHMSNKARIVAQVLSGEGGTIAEHVGVFKRNTSKRLPIKERYGVSVVGAFEGAPDLIAQVIKDSEESLDKRIRSKVDYFLSKLGTPGGVGGGAAA